MPGRTINNLGDSGGQKRSRRDRDEGSDDEDAVAVREASSNLRTDDRRKRARISAGKQRALARATSDDSDDSSNAEENDAETTEDTPANLHHAATQYDLLRDAGFKHLRNAEQDDKRATQRLQQRELNRQSNRAVANHAADNGIIESIQCVNFMCHDNLHVELGPLLNFIVGENGSGKSAVLTAITLCLGGKASSTNRGGSLKSFIKEGREKSKLIVKIKNKGRDAYQNEIYGDTILVERHFSRAGSSGFFVKSETGRTISTKKRDVDEIVEYYCLQVDNPLNVLSQDNARQFLNQASSKQKYRFFCQGVQLQQLDDDYRVIEEYLNANEHKEGDLEVKVEVSRKEFEKAKKAFELLQESSSMKDELTLLRHKAIWAQVIDKERELADCDSKLADAEQNIADTQTTYESQTKMFDRMDAEVAQCEQDLEAVRAEEEGLSVQKDEAERVLLAAKRDLAKLMSYQRDARIRLDNAIENREGLKQNVQDEERRLEELNGDVVSKKNEELEAVSAKIDQAKKSAEDNQKLQLSLEAKLKQADGDCKATDDAIKRKQKDIEQTTRRINEIVKGQGSLYDAYEPNMRRLLQMIDADAGFERKPVGPIGAHIQVQKPVWNPMLERLFGESLNGFVVISRRDQARLRSIMERAGVKYSPIIIGNPHPIDTSQHEPDELYTTVLSILQFGDPLIRNQLIINNTIEKTILVENKNDADRIMLGTAAPPNVRACYHPLPSKGHGWFVRLTVNTNGVSSTPQEPPRLRHPRLQSDSQQEKTLLEQRLSQFQGELRDLRNQRNQQQQACGRYEQDIKECKRSKDRLANEKRMIGVEKEKIQRDLESLEGVDGRLQEYSLELAQAIEAAEQYGREYGTIGLRKNEKNEECKQLEQKKKEETKKAQAYETRLHEADDKLTRAKDNRHVALTAKNTAYEDHQKAKYRKDRIQRQREGLQETVTDWAQQAEAQVARVQIWENETYAILEKKMDSLRKTLAAREKKRGMTDEEVSDRAEQAKEAYESLKKAYDQVCKENKGLKSTLTGRLGRWRQFQRYISSNSRAAFMFLLSERDYRGRLVLDHINHTLDVQVEPDKTKKVAEARKTTTLSGGEKSFSSVCLLLAIWEAMGSPLRCLDEFDVFMDSVNRKISTDMLCSAARNSVGRQYILITPNAVEGRAKLSKDVKITRLTDPRQKQITDYNT